MHLKRLQGLFFAILVGLAFVLPRLCLSASCPGPVMIEHSCCTGMSEVSQNSFIHGVCCLDSNINQALSTTASKHTDREQKEILLSLPTDYPQVKTLLALQVYAPLSTPSTLKLRTLSPVLRI